VEFRQFVVPVPLGQYVIILITEDFSTDSPVPVLPGTGSTTMMIVMMMMKVRVVLLYLGFIVFAGTVIVEAAASSSSSYSPYQYDLTIPQYTPDGRLLQVEYAQKASQEHSIPIIVATMMVNSHVPRKGYYDRNAEDIKNECDHEQITIMIAGHRTRTGQQSRLILLPLQITTICGGSSSNRNICESMIVIAISGILSDALAILQMIQSFRIQEYRTIGGTSGSGSGSGSTSSTMVRRIAYQIASTCQSRTIAGGKRPYGATLWIMATNNNAKSSSSSSLSPFEPLLLHQVDPSGAIYDIQLQPPLIHSRTSHDTAVYENSTKLLDVAAVAVLGGGGTISSKIQRRLQHDWITAVDHNHQPSGNNNTGGSANHQGHHDLSSNMVQGRIGHILLIAMEEYQNHYSLNAQHDEGNSKIDTTTNTQPKPQDSQESSDSTTSTAIATEFYDHLEVVLVSSKRGTLKFTSDQIDYFIQQYKASQS
jgi:Proteasome subunit A N-terminal signature